MLIPASVLFLSGATTSFAAPLDGPRSLADAGTAAGLHAGAESFSDFFTTTLLAPSTGLFALLIILGLVAWPKGPNFMLPKWAQEKFARRISGFSGSMMLAVGGSLLGVSLLAPEIQRWDFALYRLPWQVSLSITVLGGTIVAWAMWADNRMKSRLAGWVPVSVGLGSLIAIVILWQAERGLEDVNLRRSIRFNISSIASYIRDQMELRLIHMESTALHWEEHHDWGELKESAIGVVSMYYQQGLESVLHILPDNQVSVIHPLDTPPDKYQTELLNNPEVVSFLKMVSVRRGLALSRPMKIGGENQLLLAAIPLHSSDRPAGFMVSIFKSDALLDLFLVDPSEMVPGMSFGITSGGRWLWPNKGIPDDHIDPRMEELGQEIPLRGSVWRIMPVFSGNLKKYDYSTGLLAYGLVLSTLLTVSVILAYRVENKHWRQANLDSLAGSHSENQTINGHADGRAAELDTRLKQMNCLLDISAIAVNSSLETDDLLRETVRILPSGFSGSRQVHIRIELDGKIYQNGSIPHGVQAISVPLATDGVTRGEIMVAYQGHDKEKQPDRFMYHEHRMLKNLAEILDSTILGRELLKEKGLSLRQHEQLVNSLPQAVFLRDSQGRFLQVNNAFAALSGLSRQECQDSLSSGEFSGLGDVARTFVGISDEEVIRSGSPLCVPIAFADHTESHLKSCSLLKIPLKDERGEVTAVVSIMEPGCEHS
ncbi:MAG: PAS domain-containing protein [Deltaproteobacteria bacterium]|nr:PAS domain-containing protein [Deltaproteobacteria bacterium]